MKWAEGRAFGTVGTKLRLRRRPKLNVPYSTSGVTRVKRSFTLYAAQKKNNSQVDAIILTEYKVLLVG